MNEPIWRRYVRFWGPDITRDVDDELRFHVDMRVAEFIRAGMTPEEARAAADERFGNAGQARNECVIIRETHEKSMTRTLWLDGVMQDVRFTMRLFRRQPLPTLASILCLALGIGASTSMFSVADTMLRRPLPFPNGDRLVSVGTITGGRASAGVSSYPDFNELRARQRTFYDLGASSYQDFTWRRDVPTRVVGAVVSSSLFNTLGVHAERGRLLREADSQKGAERVAVVSTGFATRWFGNAEGAIDKSMNLGGLSYRVVGVIPDAWRFPERADLFVALETSRADLTRGDRFLRLLGTLAPGATLEQAKTDVQRVANSLRHDFADDSISDLRFALTPLRERYLTSSRPILAALGAATLLVLLIACANVAGLQLARAAARYREIALRVAIGARRSRVLRQVLTESVLLALVSGVAGCVVAWWGSRLIGRAATESAPPWMTFALDPWALAFAVLVSALAGIAFGIVPALRLGRFQPSSVLRSGQGQGPERGRLQRTFVATEIALSTVLLVSAGLALQSVRTLSQMPLGFDPDHVLTFKVNLQGARYDSSENRASVIKALTDRIASLPSVRSVGAVTRIPISGCCSQFGTTIEGREGKDPGLMVSGNMVTPAYFETMRIRVLKGRGILASDVRGGQRVVVINETFARTYWPDADAIGRRIDTGGGWADVVGVVSDIKQNSLMDGPEPQFYRAHSQDPWEDMTFAIRTSSGDPAQLTTLVRRAFREIDATQPIYGVVLMSALVEGGLRSERTLGQLLTAFAVVALVLAASGVYAAMSFFVSQRSQELGVRMALGADRGTVFRLVMSRAALITIAGVAVGLVAAVAAARVLSQHLFGVNAADPFVYAVAAGTLALATLAATLAPSRRAVSVDPMTVLRADEVRARLVQ